MRRTRTTNNKYYQIMRDFLLCLWQLPQNLIGLLAIIILRGKYNTMRAFDCIGVTNYAKIYVSSKINGGVSLGRYIILHDTLANSQNVKSHETGHCKQSIYLGWLYLIVIGLPSITWNVIHTKLKLKRSYYWFYTEAWANRLGNVDND